MFNEIVGQDSICKQVEVSIIAAKNRKSFVESMIIYGADQNSRIEMADAIVKELGCSFKLFRSEQVKVKKASEWAGEINSMNDGDCIIIEGSEKIPEVNLDDIFRHILVHGSVIARIGKGTNVKEVELVLPTICFIFLANKINDVPHLISDNISNVYRMNSVTSEIRLLWIEDLLRNANLQMEYNSIMGLANLNISKMRIKKIIKHFENLSLLTGNRKCQTANYNWV